MLYDAAKINNYTKKVRADQGLIKLERHTSGVTQKVIEQLLSFPMKLVLATYINSCFAYILYAYRSLFNSVLISIIYCCTESGCVIYNSKSASMTQSLLYDTRFIVQYLIFSRSYKLVVQYTYCEFKVQCILVGWFVRT